ncbi:MAG: HAMP domain-containing protein [Geopsychrobacter sp.]|nr:HAMP domain-containing protein [Geopsychrobacter sp.]
MRITVKHQVLLAPALVLLLLTMLLAFMQYTYWDLSVKRREAKALGTAFISLAEADLASRRMQRILLQISRRGIAEENEFESLASLSDLAASAVARIEPFGDLVRPEELKKLRGIAADLSPGKGADLEHMLTAVAQFRSMVTDLTNLTAVQRQKLRDLHTRDIDELVERTALVMILVVGVAILVGIVLSLYFGRRILSRIQALSLAASRIAEGDLEPPAAPERIDDELDTLSLSINRMARRLIQVVGTEKLFEGAEDERRRIAMDLHDQTLADLSSILREIQSFAAVPENPCRKQAQGLERSLSSAMSNLRDIMNNLHPQTLDILGLGAALEAHLEGQCDGPNLPQYHYYYDQRIADLGLSRLQQLSLYRIAIEAIRNVIQHADAGRFEVGLELRGSQLVLSVEDNGRGFNLPLVGNETGRGLNNLRARERSVGADVDCRSSRFSSGTRFELKLPVATLLVTQDDRKEG